MALSAGGLRGREGSLRGYYHTITIHPSSPWMHGRYIKRHWDKPFSHRVPVRGFVRLDIQDMGELGLADEEQRFHRLFQKKYKFSALAISALNVTSLLTAYQVELLEEMGCLLDAGSPNPAL